MDRNRSTVERFDGVMTMHNYPKLIVNHQSISKVGIEMPARLSKSYCYWASGVSCGSCYFTCILKPHYLEYPVISWIEIRVLFASALASSVITQSSPLLSLKPTFTCCKTTIILLSCPFLISFVQALLKSQYVRKQVCGGFFPPVSSCIVFKEACDS